jgi:hypothetical protein
VEGARAAGARISSSRRRGHLEMVGFIVGRAATGEMQQQKIGISCTTAQDSPLFLNIIVAF